MFEDIPTRALTVALTGAVLAALLASARSAAPSQTIRGTLELHYPFSVKLIGIVGGTGLPVLTVLALTSAKAREPWALAPLGLVLGSLALLGIYVLIETLFMRLEYDESGLTSYVPWRGRRHVPWNSIRAASYSRRSQWIVLRSDHAVIRASVYLIGIAELTEAIRRHVPAERCLSLPFDEKGRPANRD